MRINIFFVLVFFFLLVAPVSASHANAMDAAQKINDSLSGLIPYTVELTDTQVRALGINTENLHRTGGTYKITIKSSSYDPSSGLLTTNINAWYNNQPIAVNNPVHWYMANGASGSNGVQRRSAYALRVILFLDSIPDGNPINDDTTVIFPAEDARIGETTDGSYATVRGGAGDVIDRTANNAYTKLLATANQDEFSELYSGYLVWNTSVIPDTDTITSGNITVFVYLKGNGLGSPSYSWTSFAPADPFLLAIGDYDSLSYTELTDPITYANIVSTGSYKNVWELNAAGLSAISKTGNTSMALSDSWRISGTFSGTWASTGNTFIQYRTVDNTGDTYDPFLTIVHAPSGDTTPPTSLTNMANTTNCSQTNITWTNPPDSDFNHTYTMWQNVFDGNLSNTTTFRLKTGLTESNLYTLSTKTCDLTGNCNTTWINHSITTGACGVAPVAAFSANNLTVCQGTPTTFTDASTNGPLTWLWDFGDGNTSALQNPQHTYDVIGLKTVNLTANNTYGSDFERKADYINVTACAAPPTPTPTPTPTLAGCLYTNITTTIDENNTEWQAQAGNYTWGTVIINRTQGNISWYSCYATPTPAPTPPWRPEINPPSPDNLLGTVKLWIKEWLRDVFT